MKNFLVLVVNLSVVAFGLAALGTFLNYLFGLNIGIQGSTLPDDPAIGFVFLCMATVFGAIAFFVNRKKEAAQPSES